MTDTSQELPLRLVFGTIPKLRKQKDWVGGFRKWPFMETSVLYCIYVEIVGGSEKAQKYADVIYEWSLCDLFCVKNLFTGSHPTYPKTISVTSKVRIDFTNSYVGNLNWDWFC